MIAAGNRVLGQETAELLASSGGNLSIVKSTRVPGWARPVQRWTTKMLLKRIGLPMIRNWDGNLAVLGNPGAKNRYARRNQYDLWDELQAHWKKRRRIHPDAPGGSEIQFKWLSAIYTELKVRMRRNGVLE